MTYSRILVPVAPAHGDEAGRAVEVARSLAAPDAQITVITVVEDLPPYLRTEAYVLNEEAQESRQSIGQAVVDEFTAPDTRVLVRHGHPTRMILDEAGSGSYDCIVIPSAQPGWGHFFLGSTASSVVRHAHCSVHVVRHQDSAAS
ncbi:MAG: universal stress protein [Acidobacteria bacterium]|nr:MAG: universal stress protein [Acidobacteriota bacterium]